MDIYRSLRVAQRHSRRHPPTCVTRSGGGKFGIGRLKRFERHYSSGITVCAQGRCVVSAIGADVEHQIDIAVFEQAVELRAGRGMDAIPIGFDPCFSQQISDSI